MDVSDALGTKRMNLTKTLRKTPIDLNLDHHGAAYEDNHKVQPKYDDEDMWVSRGVSPGGEGVVRGVFNCIMGQQGGTGHCGILYIHTQQRPCKTRIDLRLNHHGAAYEDNDKVQPKYDDEDVWVSEM